MLCLAGLVATALAAPAIAPAADPTDAQYHTSVGQIEEGVGVSGDPGSEESAAGPLNSPIVDGLPFTGLDVVALASIAVALVALGLILRRLTVPLN